MKNIFIITGIIFLLTGCSLREPDWQEKLADSVDPINALQADAVSTKWTEGFWREQKDKKTRIWKHAIAFCMYHTEYPNCIVVVRVLNPNARF